MRIERRSPAIERCLKVNSIMLRETVCLVEKLGRKLREISLEAQKTGRNKLCAAVPPWLPRNISAQVSFLVPPCVSRGIFPKERI